MSRRSLAWLGLLGAGLGLAWIGHALLFSTFMLYDDEGYVLISLRDFGLHGGLYTQVYSQYGPFFYLSYDALHRLLDFEWSNTTGRWVTLANWLGTAGLCGAIISRCRLQPGLAVFVMANVFTLLWISIHEPSHPGSFTSLLVAMAAFGGTDALHRGNSRRFAIIVGAIGAALVLVKVNVGVFVFFAAVFWLVLSSPSLPARKGRLILAGLGLLLPFPLMQSLIAEPWVLTYACISGMSIASAVLGVAPILRSKPEGARTWGWLVASAAVVTVITTVGVLIRGTSLMDLVEGVALGPLRHPGVYSFAAIWRFGAPWAALAALAFALYLAQGRPPTTSMIRSLAWGRIVVILLFQLPLLPGFSISQVSAIFNYGLPLAGLLAWPLASAGRQPGPADLTRAWLALLVVFQALHAYPIAGSQLNWGTFLWCPLMALGLQDAIAALSGSGAKAGLPRRMVGFTAIALATLMGGTLLNVAVQLRRHNVPLGLPGAETIILPASRTSAMRTVVANISTHGDLLISFPGMYSYNLWSGVPTPTSMNVTHWFSLLNTTQQQEIIERINAADRPLLLVETQLLGALLSSGYRATGPLVDYLYQTFERALTVDGQALWVRKGRTIAPVQSATLQLDSPDILLTATLNAFEGSVATIRIRNLASQGILDLNPANSRVSIRPLSPDGTGLGDATDADWPFSISTLSRIEVRFAPDLPLPPTDLLETLLLDEAGQVLTEARVLPMHALSSPSAP